MKSSEKKAFLNQVQTLLNNNGISGHKLIPFMSDLSQYIGSPDPEIVWGFPDVEPEDNPVTKAVMKLATGNLLDNKDLTPGGYRGSPKCEAFYRRRRMNAKTKVGSVIQVNEKGPAGWIGCLVRVTEMKSWGIQGCLQLPGGNVAPGELGRINRGAYIRLKTETFDYIGEAVMVPADENGEG